VCTGLLDDLLVDAAVEVVPAIPPNTIRRQTHH
jgi:hypothetical protein